MQLNSLIQFMPDRTAGLFSLSAPATLATATKQRGRFLPEASRGFFVSDGTFATLGKRSLTVAALRMFLVRNIATDLWERCKSVFCERGRDMVLNYQSFSISLLWR
jgi:hypothetical protein